MRVLAPLIALLVFSGCAFHGSRGDLSDAMESSASGSGGRSRDRHAASDSSDSSGIFSSIVSGMFEVIFLRDSDYSGASSSGNSWVHDDDDFRWRIPMDVSHLVPLNGDMKAFNRFTITPVAFEDWRNHVGFYLGGGSVKFESGSLPDRAVEDAWIFELGINYRRYLNDPHVFLSPYLAANVAWQPLFWDYRNSVISGDDIIDSDRLDGMNLYTGLGVAIRRSKFLGFFGEAGFGGTVYFNHTNKGFRNDVFDNFGYFAVKAGLTLSF